MFGGISFFQLHAIFHDVYGRVYVYYELGYCIS